MQVASMRWPLGQESWGLNLLTLLDNEHTGPKQSQEGSMESDHKCGGWGNPQLSSRKIFIAQKNFLCLSLLIILTWTFPPINALGFLKI